MRSAALLERFPPPAVVAVPRDRRLERFVEGAGATPPECGDLGDVDRVTAVVTETVGDVLHRLLTGPEEREQLVDEDTVRGLVAGADVVELARRAVVEHQLHARAVVVDEDPVALVE